MKIIGQANENYIVSVSSVELANILGFYSNWDDGFRGAVATAIKHETDLQVSKIYEHYYNLKHVVTSNEGYDNARKRLEDMLKALTPIEDLLIEEKKLIDEDNKA